MLGDLPKGKVKILREILEENGDWEKLVPDEKLWKEVNRMKGSKSPFIDLLNALVDEGCTVERFEEHMRNNLSPGVFPEVCRAVDGNDMVKTRRGTSEQCTPHAQEEASAEVQTESQCLPFFRAPELESLTTRKQRRLENRNIQLQIDFPGFQNRDKSGIFRQTTDSRVNSSVFARLRGAKRNAAHPGSHIRGYPTKKRPGMEAEMARDETDACKCGNREAASCGSTTPASLDYCYHELVYLEDTLDNEERDHLHHIVDNDNYEDYDHTEFCVVICDLEI